MGSEAKNSDTEPAHRLGLHCLYIPCTWLRFHPDWSWLGSKLLITTNRLPGCLSSRYFIYICWGRGQTYFSSIDRSLTPVSVNMLSGPLWLYKLWSQLLHLLCLQSERAFRPSTRGSPFSPSNLSFSRLSSTPLFLEVAQGDFSDVDSPFIWTRIR